MKFDFKKYAKPLVLIGGIAWGLVAFGFNPVAWLTGMIPVIGSTVEKIIYAVVGVAALVEIFGK